MLAPGVKGTPSSKLQFDQLGIPSMFANTNAGSDFVPAYSGYVGDRNRLRGFHYWNDDMSISKVFKVSEGKQVSFRVEAYNLTQHGHVCQSDDQYLPGDRYDIRWRSGGFWICDIRRDHENAADGESASPADGLAVRVLVWCPRNN